MASISGKASTHPRAGKTGAAPAWHDEGAWPSAGPPAGPSSGPAFFAAASHEPPAAGADYGGVRVGGTVYYGPHAPRGKRGGRRGRRERRDERAEAEDDGARVVAAYPAAAGPAAEPGGGLELPAAAVSRAAFEARGRAALAAAPGPRLTSAADMPALAAAAARRGESPRLLAAARDWQLRWVERSPGATDARAQATTRAASEAYEGAVGRWLEAAGVAYETEEARRAAWDAAPPAARGPLLTPDFVIPGGALVNGRRVFWVDAKDMPGVATPFVTAKLRKTLRKYAAAFGPGALVYSGGLVDGFDPGALLLDGSALD